MKCIRCGIDSDYRARGSEGRCRNCGGKFAFEPRGRDPLTDLAFKNAIEAVSDDGRLAWTDRHLYYEVCRRVRRRRVLHRLFRRRFPSIDFSTFELLLAKWAATHNFLPCRLGGRVFEDDESDRPVATDAAHYAFDAIVLCDDEDIADVLLVNGFHREYRCPVLSTGGYPRAAADTLTSIFRESPPRLAFVVHDADWRGCTLADELGRGAPWFHGHEVRIVDVGMRPSDAERLRGLYLPAQEGGGPSGRITHQEAEWLRAYRLELEAVRPRTLMTVLGAAVRGDPARGHAGAAVGAGIILWDDAAWVDADEDVG